QESLPWMVGRRSRAGSCRCAAVSLRGDGVSPSARHRCKGGSTNMSLLIKARLDGREIVNVTPRSAGWKYIGFAAYRLSRGDSVAVNKPGEELCIVVLAGTVTVTRGRETWRDIGERRDVFDDQAPYAVYLPPGDEVVVTARIQS